MVKGEDRLLKMIEYYKGLLAKDPTLPVFVKLADIYIGLGRLDEARNIADQGLTYNQNLPGGWTILARISRESGEIDKANEYITKSLNLDSFNVESLLEEALVLMDMGDENKALLSLDKALEIEPDNDDIKKLRASIRAKFRFAEVKDYIDRSRKKRIGFPTEKTEEVIAKEKEVSEKEEKLASPYLAEVYLRQGYLSKAREVCEKVLETDPADEKARDILKQIKEAELSMKGLSGDIEFELAPVPKPIHGEEGESEFDFGAALGDTFSGLELEEEILTEPIGSNKVVGFDFDVIEFEELGREKEHIQVVEKEEVKKPDIEIPSPEVILVKSKPPELELPEDIDISELDTEEEDISKFQEWLDRLIME